MKKWYWISFVDTKTHLSLGCCNVQADSKVNALKKTHILGINPGGEAMIVEMPHPEILADKLVDGGELVAEEYITLQQASKMLGIPVEALPGLDYVCQKCNETGCNCNN